MAVSVHIIRYNSNNIYHGIDVHIKERLKEGGQLEKVDDVFPLKKPKSKSIFYIALFLTLITLSATLFSFPYDKEIYPDEIVLTPEVSFREPYDHCFTGSLVFCMNTNREIFDHYQLDEVEVYLSEEALEKIQHGDYQISMSGKSNVIIENYTIDGSNKIHIDLEHYDQTEFDSELIEFKLVDASTQERINTHQFTDFTFTFVRISD